MNITRLRITSEGNPIFAYLLFYASGKKAFLQNIFIQNDKIAGDI